MFTKLIDALKATRRTIVFTEGTDPRILEASARLLSGNFLKPVLVGNPEEIAAAAEDAGFNIRGAEIAVDEPFQNTFTVVVLSLIAVVMFATLVTAQTAARREEARRACADNHIIGRHQ